MLNPKIRQLLQTEMSRKEFLRLGAITVASLVGITGVLTELMSHAATPYASSEAESGNLGGKANLSSDANASGGKAVIFGSGGVYALAVAALPSLALWLPLNDATGTSATDYSGTGSSGSYSSSGVSYAVVDPGAALGANKAVTLGTSATVSVPNKASLRLACTASSAWTLTLRIMVPSSNGGLNGSGYPLLLSLGDDGAASGFQMFYSPSYGTIGIHLGGTTAAAVNVNSLQSAMSTLAITWNGSVLSYYQNGSLIITNTPVASASITDTSSPLVIGPDVTVDQVIIAESCASAATIASLYTNYTTATDGSPLFTAESAPAAVINTAYSYQYKASGQSPITYGSTGTLPTGLSLSTAGLLAGTPTASGSSSFVVVATNSIGSIDSSEQTVAVETSGSAAVGFASATVWQDDNIRKGIDSTINPNNASVAAVINKDAADMQAAGITWVRYWPSIATPSSLAGIFQLFKNHNINMIYCYNSGSDASNESAVINGLDSIVPAVSAVGCHVWEIGNEMNLASSPWTTNNPVGNYCTRLKDAYTTIKAHDSSAFVIAGGISYNQSYTADGSTTSDSWFNQFCSSSNGMWNYCDGIGIHPYSDSNTAGVFSALSDTRSTINNASGGSNFANKPLCITELGWYWEPSDYYGNQHGGVSPATEAERDSVWAATMNQLKSNGINGGTFPICYYTWYDGNYNTGYGVTTYTGPTSRNYSGLYTAMQDYKV